MTTMEQEVPATEATLSPEDVSSHIQRNLCAIYVTTSRPTGRIQANDVKVEVRNDFNEQQEADKDSLTTPCWKLDINQRWKVLDANGRAVQSALMRYAVGDSVKGEYLISIKKAPTLLNRLKVLLNERMEIATDIQSHEAEIRDELKSKYATVYETQIKDRINFFSDIRRRYGILWIIKPLTVMRGDELDFSNLSESEAIEVAAQTNKMLEQMAKDRFQNVLDTVFGEVLDLAESISTGDYSFSRRRPQAVQDILSLLDRIKTFDMYATKDILTRADFAANALKNTNLGDLKNSELIQSTIRDAFRPLGAAIAEGLPGVMGSGRVKRTVE